MFPRKPLSAYSYGPVITAIDRIGPTYVSMSGCNWLEAGAEISIPISSEQVYHDPCAFI